MINSDPELDTKVKRTSEKISENMHIVANDPSLAFYRIQEHVRKVMPMIIDRRTEVEQLKQDLQGHCYDLDYAVGAIKSIETSEQTFKNIQDKLKNTIFTMQQLQGDEQKRRPNTSSNQSSSVYKRWSAHIQTTLDLPDIDLSNVVRETTSRVENMMSHARSGATTSSANNISNNNNNNNRRNSTTSANNDSIQRSHTTLH